MIQWHETSRWKEEMSEKLQTQDEQEICPTVCVSTDLFPELGRTRSWTCSPRRPSAPSKPRPWSLQDPSGRQCGWCFCSAAGRPTSGSSDEAGNPESSLQTGSNNTVIQTQVHFHSLPPLTLWLYKVKSSRSWTVCKLQLRTDLWALQLNRWPGAV